MLDVGDVLEIRGKQVTVCFSTEYNNQKYICVADASEKFDIFKYKLENDKLLIADVVKGNDLDEVLKIFIKESVDKHGIPKEAEPILDYLESVNKEQ